SPDDRNRLLPEIRAAAAGRPRSLELRLGGVLVRAELAPFAGGRAILTFTDETPRADAEQRLRQGEARYKARRRWPTDDAARALPDAIPQLVWGADPSGRVDFLNRQFLEQTGLDAAFVRTHGMTDAIHPDDRKMVATRWSRCLATGAPFEAVYRL